MWRRWFSSLACLAGVRTRRVCCDVGGFRLNRANGSCRSIPGVVNLRGGSSEIDDADFVQRAGELCRASPTGSDQTCKTGPHFSLAVLSCLVLIVN